MMQGSLNLVFLPLQEFLWIFNNFLKLGELPGSPGNGPVHKLLTLQGTDNSLKAILLC